MASGTVVYDTLENCYIDEDEVIRRPDCLLVRDAAYNISNHGILDHAQAEAIILCEAGHVELASFGKNITASLLEEYLKLVICARLEIAMIKGHLDEILAPMELKLFQEHSLLMKDQFEAMRLSADSRQIAGQEFLH